MNILTTIAETRKKIKRLRKTQGFTIGLVPTMGALHAGHLSLIEQSRIENDITIASIYVNPVQFNNPQDYQMYPVQHENDFQLLEEAGCHYAFVPDQTEMYPHGADSVVVNLDFGALSHTLEGAYRPGHFSGVGVVVSKLLHIINPDKAYFGQKDMQQFLIIQKMVDDLSMGTQVVCCPTVREKDGLAMSSRNQRLTEEERQKAPLLYQTMLQAKKQLLEGISVLEVKASSQQEIGKEKAFRLEYFEVVDAVTLAPATENTSAKNMAIMVAAHLGKARLIDNLLVKPENG